MKSSRPATITPFLTVKSGAKAVEFYIRAFGAQQLEKYDIPNGRQMSRIAVQGADVWVGDEEQEFNNLSPDSIGGSAVRIILNVNEPDSIFTKALEAGATQICPMTTEEYWRIGKLRDPFGHIWEIGRPLDVDEVPAKDNSNATFASS